MISSGFLGDTGHGSHEFETSMQPNPCRLGISYKIRHHEFTLLLCNPAMHRNRQLVLRSLEQTIQDVHQITESPFAWDT